MSDNQTTLPFCRMPLWRSAGIRLMLVGLMLLIGIEAVNAQSSRLRKADRLFDQYRFTEAIDIYAQLLTGPETVPASLKLAECYFLTGHPEKAEPHYASVLQAHEVLAIFYLHYAQVLQSNGKCGEALFWYGRYAELNPEDERGRTLPVACEDIAMLLQQEGNYELLSLDINTAANDMVPVIYRNGIVFTSTRERNRKTDTDAWTGAPFFQLYFASGDKNEFEDPVPLSEKVHSLYNDGPATFNGTGNTMYLSRNNTARGGKMGTDRISKLQLFKASLVNADWDRFDVLPFCEPDHNYTHPAITPDGRTLYFSSDRPGGQGGMDLWVVRYNNEQWSEPENLGAMINTPGNDVFPFVHDDGTLYFASDGHPGLGGLDIFEARWQYGRFVEVDNMRSPINSNRDDYGLVFDPDREQGYFSSNRDGGKGGDDVYSLARFPLFVSGILVDAETMQGLEQGQISVMRDDEILHNITTGEDGFFLIRISPFETYDLIGYRDGYNQVEYKLETGSNNRDRIVLPLEKLIAPEHTLALTIKVIDRTSKLPLAGENIFLVNTDRDSERKLTADENGQIELLIDNTFHYELKADGSKFFYRLEVINPELMSEVRRLTRIMELTPFEPGKTFVLNITYEHAEYDLDWDDMLEIDKLVKLMKEEPALKVEIGSHTDSNGSDATNNRVSQRRADAVVKYMITQGIEKNRLSAVGYGESHLLNDCVNDVPCSEEKHRQNRRTEYKILAF